MKNKNIYKDVDSLINGIETILLESRCSFSNNEKVLLTDAVSYLKEIRKKGNGKPFDWSLTIKVFEALVRVFGNYDDFMNFF